jgi:hypothetical protein
LEEDSKMSPFHEESTDDRKQNDNDANDDEHDPCKSLR